MRIVFNIRVGVDVPSYVQAGEVLDKVTRDLSETVGSNGEFDVSNFESVHRKVRQYPNEGMQAVNMEETNFTDQIRR